MDVRAMFKDERIYILFAHYKEYLCEIKEMASYIFEGDNVHVELNLNMSSLLKELRTQYSYDIRGRKEVLDKTPLISAYLSYIQSSIYFPEDYDSDSEMSLFINGYFDYKDQNTMESVYI